MTEKLFPLRLSDFEEYAFRDDSPAHPMVIVLRVVIDGELNEQAFRNALRASLSQNPILRSVIKPNGRAHYWHPTESDQLPLIVERYGNLPPRNCPQKSIDLTTSPGLHFDLRVSTTESVLIAYFHHACCDGIGSIQFIGDVFAEYGQLTARCPDERPVIREISPECLRIRGTRRMPGDSKDRRAPIGHTLLETSRLFLRRSFRFQSRLCKDDIQANEAVRNVIHTRVLPGIVLRRLRKFAASRGVTTNDVCLAVFLQLLAVWSKNKSPFDYDLLRILMPVSMRSPEHDAIPSANVVSYCFHSYFRKETTDFDSLLKMVHQKSHQMVNRNEGAAMLYGFAISRMFPGLFRLARRVQPDFATAVLTNVGEVRRLFNNRFPLKQGRAVAGNVIIHRVDGVAPVRENTNIAMSCGTYGGELIVHINRNTRIFSEADGQAFVNAIADRFTALANSMAHELPSGCRAGAFDMNRVR